MTASISAWLDFGAGVPILTALTAVAIYVACRVATAGRDRTGQARRRLGEHPVRFDGGVFTVDRSRACPDARCRQGNVVYLADRRVADVVPIRPLPPQVVENIRRWAEPDDPDAA